MGTWGPGNLDNDTARDWLARWRSAGVPAISAAIDAVVEDDSDILPATKAEEALAALEVLAAIHGQPEDEHRVTLPRLTEDQVIEAEACHGQASLALMRIGGAASELHVLWDDAGADEFEAWISELRGLRARLEAAAGGDAPAVHNETEMETERGMQDEDEIPVRDLVEKLLEEIGHMRADIGEMRHDLAEGIKRVRRDVLGAKKSDSPTP